MPFWIAAGTSSHLPVNLSNELRDREPRNHDIGIFAHALGHGGGVTDF